MHQRWGKTSRRRSIIGVGLVSVFALVAAACSSNSSSPAPPSPAGAKENTAISSNDWPFELVKQNGQPLDTITGSSGSTAQNLVINAPHLVRATVPADVAASGLDIFLEYRRPGGAWLPIRKVPVSYGGMVDVGWNPGMERSGPHEYRLAAMTIEPTKQTVFSTSSTVMASGNLEYSIALLNKTSNDLDIKIPLRWNAAAGNWDIFTVPLSQGEQKTLTYVNPPVGTGFSMILNRQRCFSGCDDYLMDFTWAPDGFQPCIANQPHFGSGGDFTVTLSDDINGQGGGLFGGWKVGKIQGPLAGPGAATDTCTFTTRTRTGTWLANHPVEGVVIIAAIVVLVAVTVFVTVELLALAPAADLLPLVLDNAAEETTTETMTFEEKAESAIGKSNFNPTEAVLEPSVEVTEPEKPSLHIMFDS